MRWLQWSPRVEVGLAIACLVAAQVEVVILGPSPVRVACAALATLPIAVRQRVPLVAAALVAAAWAVFHLWDGIVGEPVFFFATLPVIYSTGAHPKLARAVAGGGLLLAAGEVAPVVGHDRGEYAFLAFVIVLVWLSGRGARIHRDQSARLRALSARLVDEREVVERLAVAQERRRMVGELHDAIAHAVSLMVIQAGGAEQMVGRDPDRVRAALTAVQDTGRQAITELQRVLHLLRATPAAAPEPVMPLPAPMRWYHLPCTPWADLALAVIVVVGFDVPVFLGAPETRVPIAVAAAGAVLAIAIRRRLPRTALAVALVLSVATGVVLGDAMGYSPVIAMAITIYTVTVHSPMRRAIPVVVGAVIAFDLAAAVLFGPGRLVLDTAWLLVYVIGAGCVRGYRHQAERLRTLTARLVRERAARARLAVLEERARVARDLHDSVAHAVSVMVLQAGAAEQVLSTSPERARAAIHAVETQGQQAHNDLRHLLGVLDQGDATPRTPQPSLTHLNFLLAQVAQTGLPVTLHVHGQTASLPTGLDISAYRIVQEGLTNTLKHAGQVPTTVTLDYRPEALTIEIRDTGNGPNLNTHDCHGLLGMRERMDLYGGTLEAGQRPGGGFTVTARLPIEPS
jgi:signal transduction histidine kinase